MNPYLENYIARINEAITNKGSHPEYHDEVMERHRKEWPFLWHELDIMMAGYADYLRSVPLEALHPESPKEKL